MPNLLDKLNVLVRSSVNSLLDEAGDKLSSPGKLPAARLGSNIDSEIAALRKKIDEALNTEDGMQQRLDAMQQQIAAYDQTAMHLVLQGDEATARDFGQQMQHLQQQATMAKTNLEEHRRSTSDFIERVNMLEAMVSDARRTQNQQSSTDNESASAQTDRSPGVVLSNLLRDARERVEAAVQTPSDITASQQAAAPAYQIKINIEGAAPEPEPTNDTNASANVPVLPNKAVSPSTPIPIKIDKKPDEASVDDDLAKRRSRLSKPD